MKALKELWDQLPPVIQMALLFGSIAAVGYVIGTIGRKISEKF